MNKKPISPLPLLALPAMAVAMWGISCQSRAEDCEETLTCGDEEEDDGLQTGGSSSTGGTTSGAGGTGGTSTGGSQMGSLGGVAGMGGQRNAGECSPGEDDCPTPGIQGIYVSPLGDDEAAGTESEPFQTLTRALDAARGQESNIYLCSTEGAYQETLAMDVEHWNVQIMGGYECDDFSPTSSPAWLIAQDPSGHRIEEAQEITISRVHLESPDATAPGESSIGLWVAMSQGVVLEDARLTSGHGAAGADGQDLTEPAAPGADGNPGTDACVVGEGEANLGGSAVTTVCDGEETASVGGRGGMAGGGISNIAGTDGDPGQPVPDPEDLDAPGTGGWGGSGESEASCDNGDNGNQGAPGADGEPALPIGALEAMQYYPPVGRSGEPGTVGGGGGGGGGAAQPSGCVTGASGGSGGGGGCPGAGAEGGQSGGGSFALVSYQSTVELDGLNIYLGNGGRGGEGGDGQDGGAGGAPGAPGMAAGGGNMACDGGRGGAGGLGGSGGGGAGGPEIGIAFVGEPPSQSGVQFSDVSAEGAEGGPGGWGNEDDGRGPTGVVATTRNFD